MAGENLFWAYWYYQLPNYVFGALLWTCLGRFLLSIFVPPQSGNYIWRWFCRLTDPVLWTVSWITPRYVLPFFLPIVGAFWLTMARVVLLVVLNITGIGPTLGTKAG